MAVRYTPHQGRFLAFIDAYTRLNNQPPAERDMQDHFRISAPSVHQMILTLERRGLVARTPGKARSLRLLLPKAHLPDLDTGRPLAQSSPVDQVYPSVARWVAGYGWIEIGEQQGFGFTARALDEGGLVCEMTRPATLAEALAALDQRLGRWFEKEGTGSE